MNERCWALLAASVIAAATAAACDAGAPTRTEPSALASTMLAAAIPSASTSTVATPTGTVPSVDADAAVADAAPSASSPAGDGGQGEVTCGKKPLPDCPLQAWMKKNVSAATTSFDYPKIAAGFASIAKLGPPGYANWVSISNDGEKAAKDQRAAGVQAACKGCHREYQAKYRKENRMRPI